MKIQRQVLFVLKWILNLWSRSQFGSCSSVSMHWLAVVVLVVFIDWCILELTFTLRLFRNPREYTLHYSQRYSRVVLLLWLYWHQKSSTYSGKCRPIFKKSVQTLKLWEALQKFVVFNVCKDRQKHSKLEDILQNSHFKWLQKGVK